MEEAFWSQGNIFWGEEGSYGFQENERGISRCLQENYRKVTVNEWGSLEYYKPPLPSPYPPFCQEINDKLPVH